MVLPLFILEDEHSFKHGGWLGKYSMLSKVLRSKKKEKKERKRKMKKRRKEKKNERKKEKNKMLLRSFWLH